MEEPAEVRLLHALQVKQWMTGWNKVAYSASQHRRKPEPHFYIFSITAVELRSLCGISRRQVSRGVARSEDLGIQRQHDRERSEEIGRFIEFGYPWSTLSEAKRESPEFHDLRKPGWLPTSIVINILGKTQVRNGRHVDASDLVTVGHQDDSHFVRLPYRKWTKSWRPKSIPPFEVIDGQHRLFSFEDDDDAGFELPVVAFVGLDISWQAYLFWTINIKPKRINASLAFDLYPLLREEDWLNRAEGHPIYRETRAQELTEALWVHPESPWYDRINMLGEKQVSGVTQAAWVRSLIATFIRPWQGRRASIGGLFGSRIADENEVLAWSRAQQAAFLILAWSEFRRAVKDSDAEWCRKLRPDKPAAAGQPLDPAFYGPYSLIGTDQGVRGFLTVVNDLCFVSASRYKLRTWRTDEDAGAGDERSVSAALATLKKHQTAELLTEIGTRLASFDWRLSSAPGLSDHERRAKLVFRGSSGYKEMRAQLLEHVSKTTNEVGRAAKRVIMDTR